MAIACEECFFFVHLTLKNTITEMKCILLEVSGVFVLAVL